jgi:hypothetical protein
MQSTLAYALTAKFYLNFETIKKLRKMPENLSEEEALILLSDVRWCQNILSNLDLSNTFSNK